MLTGGTNKSPFRENNTIKNKGRVEATCKLSETSPNKWVGDGPNVKNAGADTKIPIKEMFTNYQTDKTKSRAPKLNLASCHTSLHTGFGSNPMDNSQTCRTSGAVVCEASPRLVATERSIMRKSSMSSHYQRQDNQEQLLLSLGSQSEPATSET
ncbi:unnamed protein product [Calypogeia fissa]